MSQVRPSAAHPRAAPTRIGRQAPAATARANTAPSSATRRVLARSRGRQYCRRHAKSCEPATPTVVRLNGLAPALPALHGAQAKQSPDRRPARASQLPLSASDSSCHGAADSTPVLLPESSLAHTTLVPPRKAESQLPLGGTSPTSSLRPRFFGWCADQREVTHWNCWTGTGESAPFAKIVTKSYVIVT